MKAKVTESGIKMQALEVIVVMLSLYTICL